MYCIFSGVTKASFELFILRIINNHMLHFLNWDQYQNYNVYFLLNCWSVFTESRKSYREKVVLIFCLQSCKRLFQTIATWIKRLVIVKLCHWKCRVDALKELTGKNSSETFPQPDTERTEYFQFLTWWWEDLGKSYLKSAFSYLKTKFIEGTVQISLIWFLIFAREWENTFI